MGKPALLPVVPVVKLLGIEYTACEYSALESGKLTYAGNSLQFSVTMASPCVERDALETLARRGRAFLSPKNSET